MSANDILHTNKHTMGWLRLVGSLKLQVSFAKEPYQRDYILQKKPMILRSLLIVATPYIFLHVCERHTPHQQTHYGVATISMLLEITGLFWKEPYKRDYILQKKPMILRSLLIVATPYMFRKETYDFKEPTNRSHPIYVSTSGFDRRTPLYSYGVTTISRPLKIIGLFCRK